MYVLELRSCFVFMFLLFTVLLHITVQVVNGLMEREDWEQAIKTPIGMLPSGSGNALCASTLYEAGSVLHVVTMGVPSV